MFIYPFGVNRVTSLSLLSAKDRFMFSVSRFVRTLAPAFALSVMGSSSALAAQPLQLKVYNADAHSFHVNAVVVSGPQEAVVIDTGFTRADALRIAANVLDSGKKLTTIFVSNADPDYYFGAETLKQLFPEANVLTTPAVREKIAAKMAGKVSFWGPKMGVNAPVHPVLPHAISGTTLSVDGERIEVRGTTGLLAHRPYVWIPSIRAVVGNIAVFGNLHVWTADTQKASERQAWLGQLDDIEALAPVTVVPGHMQPGTAMDVTAVRYTRDYLRRFEGEAARAKTSADLIQSMKQAYPNAGLGIALDIGAKVNKGDMSW